MSGSDGTVIRWIPVADADALREAARRRVLAAAARAIERRGRFLIVLSGGRTPRRLHQIVRAARTDWPSWHVYFGDERCLPPSDGERNSRQAADDWLDHVPIPVDHVHAIPAELGPDAAAHAYADLLRDVGDFDLVLLGLGEDGHVASLFPGGPWSNAVAIPDALPVLDAPKAPRQRVSLSPARLSRAREVLFLIEGESKRDAVTRWRAGDSIPATAIRPASGVDVLVESGLL